MRDLYIAVFLFQTSLWYRIHSILHASALFRLCWGFQSASLPLTAERASVVYSMTPVVTTSSLVQIKWVWAQTHIFHMSKMLIHFLQSTLYFCSHRINYIAQCQVRESRFTSDSPRLKPLYTSGPNPDSSPCICATFHSIASAFIPFTCIYSNARKRSMV